MKKRSNAIYKQSREKTHLGRRLASEARRGVERDDVDMTIHPAQQLAELVRRRHGVGVVAYERPFEGDSAVGH